MRQFHIDDSREPPQPTIEARLINALRLWLVDPNSPVADDGTVEREIYGLLEWYICGCIACGPEHLRYWWSDGVVHLEITPTEVDWFKLLGVTWIDCLGVAPFEIDVEIDPSDDSRFVRTLFRLGMLDDRRQPVLCKPRFDVGLVLENRPRSDRDWAIAVELTPPVEDASGQSED